LNDTNKTQIFNTHRLIDFTVNLSKKPKKTNDCFIDIEYFINNVINEIELNLNFLVLNRQEYILKKSKNDFKKPTRIEILTKAFYDPYFFRKTEYFINYKNLENKLLSSIKNNSCIEIIFPIFSRKPISPIKNRGYFADIAEIFTILKIASFVKLIQKIIGKDIIFKILADGKKYNRVCKTPDYIVEDYQKSLQFWVDYFKLNNNIKIVDYEKYFSILLGKSLTY